MVDGGCDVTGSLREPYQHSGRDEVLHPTPAASGTLILRGDAWAELWTVIDPDHRGSVIDPLREAEITLRGVVVGAINARGSGGGPLTYEVEVVRVRDVEVAPTEPE